MHVLFIVIADNIIIVHVTYSIQKVHVIGVNSVQINGLSE